MQLGGIGSCYGKQLVCMAHKVKAQGLKSLPTLPTAPPYACLPAVLLASGLLEFYSLTVAYRSIQASAQASSRRCFAGNGLEVRRATRHWGALKILMPRLCTASHLVLQEQGSNVLEYIRRGRDPTTVGERASG